MSTIGIVVGRSRPNETYGARDIDVHPDPDLVVTDVVAFGGITVT